MIYFWHLFRHFRIIIITISITDGYKIMPKSIYLSSHDYFLRFQSSNFSLLYNTVILQMYLILLWPNQVFVIKK